MGGFIQNLLTLAKVAAFGLIVPLAFWKGHGTWEHFSPFFGGPGPRATAGAFGLAMIPVLFTYLGWNAAAYLAEEIRDPEKNVPLSILLGVFLAAALYLFVNAAYLYAMPLACMKGTVSIAESASSRLFGPSFSWCLSGLVALSILGSLGSTILIAPRVYYGMARDGLFPDMAAAVHERHGTPSAAIMIQCAWSSILVLGGRIRAAPDLRGVRDPSFFDLDGMRGFHT